MKMGGRASNGGLKQNTNRIFGEPELASAKRNDESKRTSRKLLAADRQAKKATDLGLNLEARGKSEPREIHEQGEELRPKEQSRCTSKEERATSANADSLPEIALLHRQNFKHLAGKHSPNHL